MSKRDEYRFKIDVFTVDSLPMSRLAEYMAELAKLLGEPECVHFSHMETGSAVLVSDIEQPAVPKVTERLHAVTKGRGPDDAVKAYKALDNLLANDGAVGTLSTPGNAEIINFPGRERPKPICFGPFSEHGSLDGVLVRLGGISDPVPVLLLDGKQQYVCRTTLETSKRLRDHYREGTLRVHGRGRWSRKEDGSWTLISFDIEDFEVLDEAPLTEIVGKLRRIEGGSWGKGPKAIADLLSLRRDEGNSH